MIHLVVFLVNGIIFLVKLHLNTRLARNYTHTFYPNKFFTTCFLLFSLFNLKAQSAQNLEGKKANNLIVNYLDSSWECMYTNLDKMEVHIKEAMFLAKKFDFKVRKARIHAHFGFYYEHRGNYDSAIYHHLKGIEILESHDSLRYKLVDAYHNLSGAYSTFDNSFKTLESIEKSLSIAKELKMDDDIPYAHVNLGIVHSHMDNDSLALLNYRKAVAHFHTDTMNPIKVVSYANMGKIFVALNENDSAKKYFDIYQASVFNNPNSTPFDDMHVARTFYEYNLSVGNYAQSKLYLDTAYHLAMDLELQNEIAVELNQYSNFYETVGNSDSALFYFKKFRNLVDSLESSEVRGKIVEMETKYKTAKKENKILELEGQAEITEARNTLLNVLSIFFAIIIITILIFYNINRKKSKKLAEQNTIIQQSHKEIENLIRESHHRIKNNLQVVSSLLKMQSKNVQSEEAKMSLVEAFNRVKTIALLHQRLQGSQTFTLIRLNEFITQLTDNIRASISAQNNDLKIISDVIPIEVDTDQSISIGLIINELITNSVKYAFDDEPGIVKIELQQDNGQLHLTVSDNGKGFPDNFDPQEGSSLGFKIVKSLVTKLHAKMKVENDNGAVIQIHIPIKKLS